MSKHNTSFADFTKTLMLSLTDRNRILKLLVSKVIEDFDVEHGSIWLVKENNVVPLFSLNQAGIEDEINQAVQNLRIPLGMGYVGQVAQDGIPRFDNSPDMDLRHFHKDEISKHKTENIISIPLNQANKTIGVLQLLDKINETPFIQEDQKHLMQHYAPWITIALHNAVAYTELTDLVQDFIHTLGNIIGNARIKLYFLEQDFSKFIDSAPENIDSFNEHVNQALHSIDDSLKQAFHSIEAQARPFQDGITETVRPRELVDYAIQQVASIASINVQNNVSANLPELQINKQIIVSCFIELLTNASRAVMDGLDNGIIEKGSIIISGKTKGDFVEFRFTNNGSAIPKGRWEKIFQKQLSFRKGGVNKNFGLGLWAARKFFERLGGSIKVEDSNDDSTTFLVVVRSTEMPNQTTNRASFRGNLS